MTESEVPGETGVVKGLVIDPGLDLDLGSERRRRGAEWQQANLRSV